MPGWTDEADLIIGTSAGSTAAAQITTRDHRPNCLPILTAAPPQQTGQVGSDADAFQWTGGGPYAED